MIKHNIEVQIAGSRLDKFLSDVLPDFSRSSVKNAVDDGRVTVNGEYKPAKYSVKPGDIIDISFPDPVSDTALPQDIPINIVYEDDDLVVVDKDRGMVVHPAAGNPSGTLVNALLYHVKDLSGIGGVTRPGIVHRLDKDTSGLMVVAKNDKSHASLSTQIAEKSAAREYIALVKGRVSCGGRVDKPIGRSNHDRKKMCVTSGGRNAATRYDVIEHFANYTLLHLKLETGRTHQIRVHMAHIGHGVVGDPLYGGSSKIKADGQLLHACKLSFNHPISGEEMTFESQLPEYFTEILTKLNPQ